MHAGLSKYLARLPKWRSKSLGSRTAKSFVSHNYAHKRAPHHQAPIKVIDAPVSPPELILYPNYPHAEFSSPPAFKIDGVCLKVALKSKEETVLDATASTLKHLGILRVQVLAEPRRFFFQAQ